MDIVTKCISNSEFPCHSSASHQVLAQSDLPFGSRNGLKVFKLATLGPSQISDQNYFSNSESICHSSDAFHQVWAQSALRYGRCLLKNSKMPPWRPSWMWEWNKFSSSESPMPPITFQPNPAPFQSRCRLKVFKLATMAAILAIEMEPI